MIEKCISNSLTPWSSGKKSFYFGGMPDQVYGIKPVDIGPTERSEKICWLNTGGVQAKLYFFPCYRPISVKCSCQVWKE